jgi:lysophospholipase
VFPPTSPKPRMVSSGPVSLWLIAGAFALVDMGSSAAQEPISTSLWLGQPPTRSKALILQSSEGARGTLFIFPGRSSILGLRSAFIKPIIEEGWTVYTLDWRGQGESERWLADTHLIDVQDSFDEYVTDGQELIAQAQQRGAPKPWVAMGVSLGGHILLRLLEEGAPFQAAVLQVPLCDVKTGVWPAGLARSFARFTTALGLGALPAPGQPKIDIKAILARVPPSPQQEAAAAYVATHPETLTDSVTIRWADAMFRSIEKARDPEKLRSIQAAMLMVAAAQDQICDTEACKQMAQQIPQAQFMEVQGDHFFFTREQVRTRGLQQQVRNFFDTVAPAPAQKTASRAALADQECGEEHLRLVANQAMRTAS